MALEGLNAFYGIAFIRMVAGQGCTEPEEELDRLGEGGDCTS